MNNNMGMKTELVNASNIYRKDVGNVKDQIQDLSKNIRSEQIKYRKFDNFLKGPKK